MPGGQGSTSATGTLHIAEIPHADGSIKFRYARYPSPDGQRWIRHGRFEAFHPDGQLASEGLYEHGRETGVWRDYHENGALAAEGQYLQGEKHGAWRYFSAAGELEDG